MGRVLPGIPPASGQLWHFPDEYEPISGAVLNDDEGNTARQLLAMLEARERLSG